MGFGFVLGFFWLSYFANFLGMSVLFFILFFEDFFKTMIFKVKDGLSLKDTSILHI